MPSVSRSAAGAQTALKMESPTQERMPRARMGSGDERLGKAILYTLDQLRLVEGFDQIIQAAHAQRCHSGVDGGKSGHENNLCARKKLPDGVPQAEAV